MSKAFRRYELLLPLRFNDGRIVPDELITQTLLDLRSRFGAVSCEGSAIQGQWQHGGEVYRDELVRVFVGVEDEPAARRFFVQFKEVLKERFAQLDVWITSHSVDLL